jgi:glycosyltransferase involved in cell wall biosynthesis
MESDAFIQPSVIDDGSFAVAEARTLGTPVLCVDWGGPPAVAGPDAFVASARSPEAAIRDLEAGLNRIAANPQERKSDSSLTLDGTYERLTALLLQRGITTGAGRTAR